MTDRTTTYSDESSTGRVSPSFRGLGRATVAASARDKSGFDWVLQFRRDYLPGVKEPKSSDVLAVIERDPKVRSFVTRHVSPYSIVIIDFSGFASVLFEDLRKLFPDLHPHADPLRALRSDPEKREIAEKVVRIARAHAINASVIPRIADLLRMACVDADVPLGGDGLLFDTTTLMDMEDRKLNELIARFSITIGEVFHPRTQAEAIKQSIVNSRHLFEGHVRYHSLRMTVETDRIFDQGRDDVFALVEDAHATITDFLQGLESQYLFETLRPGVLRQEDSSALLGLQAADIAAGLAASIYEEAGGGSRPGALAVRQVFERVLWNSTWIQ